MVADSLPPLVLEFDVEDNGSSKVKSIDKNLNQLGNRLDQTSMKTGTLNKKTNAVVSGFGKLKNASSSVYVAIGAVFAGLTAGIATIVSFTAVLSTGITTLANFETGVIALARVTTQSLEEAQDKILSMPSNLGTPIELVQGYYSAISAGAKAGSEAIDLLTTASKASIAAGIEQGLTIEALTKLMTGFQGEIKSTVSAADLLFAIEQEGQTTFAQLAPIIGELAALSKNTAITHTELAASLAQVTQTAGSTSQAATQLKAVMTALNRGSAELQKVFDKLNVSTAKQLFHQHGLFEGLNLILTAADDLDINYAKLFGSIEAVSGALALQANNFEGVISKMATMENRSGRTEAAFENFASSSTGLSTELSGEIQKLLISIGLLAEGTDKNLIRSLIELTIATQNWVEANKDWLSLGISETIKLFSNTLLIAANFIDAFTGNTELMNEVLGTTKERIPLTPFENFLSLLIRLNDFLEVLVTNTSISLEKYALSWDVKMLRVQEIVHEVINSLKINFNDLTEVVNTTITGLNTVSSFTGSNFKVPLIPEFEINEENFEKQKADLLKRAKELAKKGLGGSGKTGEDDGEINRGTGGGKDTDSNEEDISDGELLNKQKEIENQVQNHLNNLEDMQTRYNFELNNIQLEGVEKRIHQLEFEKERAINTLLDQQKEILSVEGITDNQRIKIKEETSQAIIGIESLTIEKIDKLREEQIEKNKEEKQRELEQLESIANNYLSFYEPEKVLLQEKIKLNELVTEGLITQSTHVMALVDAEKEMEEQVKRLKIEHGDFIDGAVVALQDYSDKAGEIAKNSYQVWSTTLNTLEDELVNVALTGELSFQKLADTILEESMRLLVIKPLLGSIFGSFGGGEGSGILNLFGLGKSAANGGVLNPGMEFFPLGGMLFDGKRVKTTKKQAGVTDGPTIMAGEKYRKEAFIPLPSGEAVPVKLNDSGKKEIKIHNSFVVYAQDAESFKFSEQQILNRVNNSTAQALRRYGE